MIYMHSEHKTSRNICKVTLCIFCVGSITLALEIADFIRHDIHL